MTTSQNSRQARLCAKSQSSESEIDDPRRVTEPILGAQDTGVDDASPPHHRLAVTLVNVPKHVQYGLHFIDPQTQIFTTRVRSVIRQIKDLVGRPMRDQHLRADAQLASAHCAVQAPTADQ